MKNKFKLFVISLLFLIVSCSSIKVNFSEEYAGKEIRTVFYLDEIPQPIHGMPGLAYAIHKKKMKIGFDGFLNSTPYQDANDAVKASEFKVNGKFEIFPDSRFVNERITKKKIDANKLKADKTLSVYDFSSIENCPDYFLILNINGWGQQQVSSLQVGLYMSYTASVYDTKKNKVIFSIEDVSQAKYPKALTGWYDGYKKELIQGAFKMNIDNILKTIQKNLK